MVGPQETLQNLVAINNLKQPPVLWNILHFFHRFSVPGVFLYWAQVAELLWQWQAGTAGESSMIIFISF